MVPFCKLISTLFNSCTRKVQETHWKISGHAPNPNSFYRNSEPLRHVRTLYQVHIFPKLMLISHVTMPMKEICFSTDKV